MPTPLSIFPGDEDESINLRLWIGIVLPPIAGGINTLVGYMVSNYDCTSITGTWFYWSTALARCFAPLQAWLLIPREGNLRSAQMMAPSLCCIRAVS
jgi:hypothetical protein